MAGTKENRVRPKDCRVNVALLLAADCRHEARRVESELDRLGFHDCDAARSLAEVHSKLRSREYGLVLLAGGFTKSSRATSVVAMVETSQDPFPGLLEVAPAAAGHYPGTPWRRLARPLEALEEGLGAAMRLATLSCRSVKGCHRWDCVFVQPKSPLPSWRAGAA